MACLKGCAGSHASVIQSAGRHRVGTVYRKAIYREYTDATKPRLH